jgi:hypothetical protein
LGRKDLIKKIPFKKLWEGVNCSKFICSNLDCSTLFFKMSTARQKNLDSLIKNENCVKQLTQKFLRYRDDKIFICHTCSWPNLTYSVLLPNCPTCSRLSIFYSFFNRTAVHVPDFQFFIIRAVDIFQCFCRAVAICAVVHFGLKLASARNDGFFDFRAVFIFLTSARTVLSSQDFGVEQFFRADEFWAVDPSPKLSLKNSLPKNCSR